MIWLTPWRLVCGRARVILALVVLAGLLDLLRHWR